MNYQNKETKLWIDQIDLYVECFKTLFSFT